MLPHRDDHAGIIREVRTRLGLTQEKFAARLGVTLPTINRWESGKKAPSFSLKEKFKPIPLDNKSTDITSLNSFSDKLIILYFFKKIKSS